MLLFVSRFNPTTMSLPRPAKRALNEGKFLVQDGRKFTHTVSGTTVTYDVESSFCTFHIVLDSFYPFKCPNIYLLKYKSEQITWFDVDKMTIAIFQSEPGCFELSITDWIVKMKLCELIECIEAKLTELN